MRSQSLNLNVSLMEEQLALFDVDNDGRIVGTEDVYAP